MSFAKIADKPPFRGDVDPETLSRFTKMERDAKVRSNEALAEIGGNSIVSYTKLAIRNKK